MSQRPVLHALICTTLLLGLTEPQPDAIAGSSGHSASAESVTFTARDFGFDGPDRIPAGMTTVTVVNQGHDLHQVQLLRLENSKSAEDFRKALATEGRLPAWIKFVGGPNAVVPGDRASATMNLAEGNYVLICLIPNHDGVPHMALGMQKPLSVTGGKPSLVSIVEPKADVTITQTDFQFSLSNPVAAGPHTIRVTNHGMQPHEVVLVKLEPGVSAKSFAEAVESGTAGPPPGRPIGGVVGLETGDQAFFSTRLEPGHYGVVCFFPDQATGKPHYSQGMATEFTVK